MPISVTTSDQYNLSVVLNDGNTVNLTTSATSVSVSQAPSINVTVSSKGPKGDPGVDSSRTQAVTDINGMTGTINIAPAEGSKNVNITDDGSGNIYIDAEAYWVLDEETNRIYNSNSGNVGIGTTTPSEKLHVVGDVRVEGDLTVNGSYTQIDTNVLTTEQWNVTNDGTGPAVTINQTGAHDIMDVQDDGTSVFYIKDGGNVGIGTASPNYSLDIESSGANARIYNTGGHTELYLQAPTASNSTINFGDSLDPNVGAITYRHASDSLAFDVNAAERIRITSSGNVGIGTTSPSEKLDVVGTIAGSRFYGSGGNDRHVFESTTTAGIVEIRPSDVRSGLQAVIMYRGSVSGTVNYLMQEGPATRFATYDGGTPSDVSGMVSLVADNNNEAPAVTIGDAGSGNARLVVGNNILLSNSGSVASYINAGNLGIGTTSPQALLQVGSVTSSVYSLATGNADIIAANKDISDTQMGTLNVTSKSKRSSSPFNQGYGPSITFTQNGSGYVDGYEKVIGGIKTEIKNATNLNFASLMQFYTHNNSSLSVRMTIDGS